MNNRENQNPKASLVEETISQARHIKEEEETRKKAARLGVSYVNIVGFPINNDTLAIIPQEKAAEFGAVPYLEVSDTVRVATKDPNDEAMQNYFSDLQKTRKVSFKAVLASSTSINYGLSLYENVRKPAERKIGEVAISKKEFQEEIKDLAHLKDKLSQTNTTELLDIMLAGAVGSRASDIHIVPARNQIRVRFRIDGVLHDISELSKDQYKNIQSRIKFLAKMKMGEQYQPQDGRFSSSVAGRAIDLRVSTLPTLHGDSIVARILEETQKSIKMEELGFNDAAMAAINEAISKPYGMVLNTGPTGSGKTTTLYAIINKLNRGEVKIVTLEDPVEYQIEGIDQTQIDPKHDLDFPRGLRAALRQDPDIIMVGEIRDFDTASIALHASLTGHLVLTTLHTNNAPAALVRLLDMRIRPFLLVGSINLAIAQRLVRLICPECKKEYQPKKFEETIIKEYLKANHLKKMPTLYTGKGCKACNNTGFLGRTAIIEFLKPNEEIEKLIMKGATQTEMERAAVKFGMTTMRQDGIFKVIAGLTTIGEVLRVTAED
jgi:type II secretory ATPase GspE/PulE/Tfp pilus assembly ATPase PilB-like protein